MEEILRSNLEESARLVQWLRDDDEAAASVAAMARTMIDCLERGGRLLSCGNGGSMCDAMHFAEELTGRFYEARPAIAAQAISDPGHLSCVANDYGYDQVFARGVEAWGRAGDVLLGFSTSGNSPNVLAAADRAHELDMRVCALLGKGGGKMLERADHALVVPSDSADRIQEIHIQVVHTLIELVERALYPENYPSPS